MRWTSGGSRDDIEDRRGMGGGGGVKLGLGGILLLGVLSLVFKQDFFSLVGVNPLGGVAGVERNADPARDAAEEPLVEFVTFVLNDAQAVWTKTLPDYRKAKLVLFREGVESACGAASSATGPFYCPGDEKVYIDLGFYDELNSRFGAPGEFAQAYVLAHEIGHHVQNVLGTERQLRRLQRSNPEAANQLSVRMELQADCYAGVWAHSTARRQLLEQGDLESGLGAAAAVGDDRIQKQSTGHIQPESWTHGSSEQRMTWFKRGYEQGRVDACNTFAGL